MAIMRLHSCQVVSGDTYDLRFHELAARGGHNAMKLPAATDRQTQGSEVKKF